MMAIEKTLFVYPWTMADRGVEETVRFLKDETHSDALYVNCSYHSGRFFQPMHGHDVLTRHSSGVSFMPDASFYPEQLQPVIDGNAQPGLHERIREACEKHGIRYYSWTVGLHQSSLGREHPEYCVTNVFGTTFDYALCPSQPVVRQYLAGLVRNVAETLMPARILIETPNFLGFVHGHHHELILSQMGEVGQYLMSLCFCDACRQRAAQEGIDTEELAVIVRDHVSYLIERERGAIDATFTHAELASLLIEEPLIHAYTQMRIRSVTELLRDIQSMLQSKASELLIVPSVFTRPGSKAWMEGTGLKQLDSFIDGIMLLSYFPDPALVKADIEWLRLFAKQAPLHAAFNAGGSDAPSEAVLTANVMEALEHQPRSINYYNASLLTRTRLKWIGNINRRIEGN